MPFSVIRQSRFAVLLMPFPHLVLPSKMPARKKVREKEGSFLGSNVAVPRAYVYAVGRQQDFITLMERCGLLPAQDALSAKLILPEPYFTWSQGSCR